ncbi:hypothetical protein ACDP63_25150, partial [Paracoccus sp. P2]|uniref:hypothetical protein n=1 Tax=Paracoccus sp. P2 TaxID=3248840 RepID=UPI00391F9F76
SWSCMRGVWVCSCPPATILDSQDESLTGFVQQSHGEGEGEGEGREEEEEEAWIISSCILLLLNSLLSYLLLEDVERNHFSSGSILPLLESRQVSLTAFRLSACLEIQSNINRVILPAIMVQPQSLCFQGNFPTDHLNSSLLHRFF